MPTDASERPLLHPTVPAATSVAPAASECTSARFDELLDLMRSIADDVHTVRALAERDAVRQRLSRDDQTLLATLLPAIMKATRGHHFTSADLAEHARLDSSRALADILANATSGSSRRLGKLLRRAVGVNVGGLVVLRVGTDRMVAVWSVVEAAV